MANQPKPPSPNKVATTAAASHTADDGVPNRAVQEQDQMQAATSQRAAANAPKKLAINEGGRTNESGTSDNPPGAVHGLPQPALKGTWR